MPFYYQPILPAKISQKHAKVETDLTSASHPSNIPSSLPLATVSAPLEVSGTEFGSCPCILRPVAAYRLLKDNQIALNELRYPAKKGNWISSCFICKKSFKYVKIYIYIIYLFILKIIHFPYINRNMFRVAFTSHISHIPNTPPPGIRRPCPHQVSIPRSNMAQWQWWKYLEILQFDDLNSS